MKVSARNRLNGTVASCTSGAVNAEVIVELDGGDRLAAVLTAASARELGLAPGSPVIALIKASWVMVMTEDPGVRLSARNCLRGTVTRVDAGQVSVGIGIGLPGGNEISAIVTREAPAELGLAPGAPAIAVIKASNVILGVPA